MAKELNKFILSAIAIVGLTVIVLVGIAVSSNFSKVLRTQTTINASLDATLVTLVINSSVAVGSTGTYPFLQSLTDCVNGTDTRGALSESFYTLSEGDKNGGLITLIQAGVEWDGIDINCSSLGYLANSDGQSAADKFSTGLGVFGTFTVILVLAIVGKAIIGLFRKKD